MDDDDLLDSIGTEKPMRIKTVLQIVLLVGLAGLVALAWRASCQTSADKNSLDWIESK